MNVRHHKRRQGFTLVEMIVVITIILVLAGLLLGAIGKAMGRVQEVRTRSDISQLAQAVSAFGVQYNVTYIPSRIRLCELYNQYTSLYPQPNPNNPMYQYELDSVAYLQKVWPRILAPGGGAWAAPNGWIDWNGDNQQGTTPYDLEGEQCIVFFLAGIQSPQNIANAGPVGVFGFGTNPRNPADRSGGVVSPFFDFKTDRLFTGAQNGFYAYIDGYGQNDGTGKNLYVYFSSYKSRNGYNRYATILGSDCASIPTAYAPYGVWPYFDGANYLNADTFQIISAGRDGRFGPGFNPVANPPGPTWSTTSAGDVYPNQNVAGYDAYLHTGPGYDDLSNFHTLFLGVPK
jgi:prepilin-type N-terminal cleavage/methylation domain-containing protein